MTPPKERFSEVTCPKCGGAFQVPDDFVGEQTCPNPDCSFPLVLFRRDAETGVAWKRSKDDDHAPLQYEGPLSPAGTKFLIMIAVLVLAAMCALLYRVLPKS